MKNIESYTQEYLQDFGFEGEMVRYRRQLVLNRLAEHAPKVIVEVGCGSEMQAAAYAAQGGSWESWTVVEPSQEFSDIARGNELPNFSVVQGFFEDVVDEMPTDPDFILCSGLLHEVPDADRLLSSVRERMGRDTVLHVNVPNARSMHRLLARSMGLIQDLKSISARNKSLQQPRVYDLEDLTDQMEGHGLTIFKQGGILVKPFTHKQMEPLPEMLGREVMDGLFRLGEEMPEIASEIYVEARLR